MKMIPLPFSGRGAFQPTKRWIAALFVLLFSAGYFGTIAWARNVHRVSQRDRAFSLKTLTVATGDVVQFTNDDEFIHQVYVKSGNFKFDSAESQPGDLINLNFTVPGIFVVQCHIHPKMMLVVTVQ
jgi:plastocyanin